MFQHSAPCRAGGRNAGRPGPVGPSSPLASAEVGPFDGKDVLGFFLLLTRLQQLGPHPPERRCQNRND
jgi:hypothetical protein